MKYIELEPNHSYNNWINANSELLITSQLLGENPKPEDSSNNLSSSDMSSIRLLNLFSIILT